MSRVDRKAQLKTGFFARIEIQADRHSSGGALHHRDGDTVGVLGLTPDPRRAVYCSLPRWRRASKFLTRRRENVADQEFLIVGGGGG